MILSLDALDTENTSRVKQAAAVVMDAESARNDRSSFLEQCALLISQLEELQLVWEVFSDPSYDSATESHSFKYISNNTCVLETSGRVAENNHKKNIEDLTLSCVLLKAAVQGSRLNSLWPPLLVEPSISMSDWGSKWNLPRAQAKSASANSRSK